jgi:hypothetical protein
MTPAGWVFMAISVGSVLGLVSYCYYKLLTSGNALDKRGTDKTTNEQERGQ